MKNFVRLVQFAWRYKVRFGLSVACAAMVALLSFTEIGAVYPLLHILFGSQNPQRWISEKISGLETDILSLNNREIEISCVLDALRSGEPRHDQLNERYRRVDLEFVTKEKELRQYEGLVGVADLRENAVPGGRTELVMLEKLRRERRLAEARRKELQESLASFLKGDATSLAIRLREIEREKADTGKLLRRCRMAQPYLNKYLPDESFKTLLLLIGLVMLGVAVKGFFMFLQEVLVADVMQLTLFDIRNMFFRRIDQPRSGQLFRPGFVGTDGPVHERHGFVRTGAQHPDEQGNARAHANRHFLDGALWINWRLTCLTMILIPISGATTIRVGKIMKRAVRRSLESMSTIYKILQESFQGIKIVKAFAMERVERRRFFDETKNLYRKSVRVAMIDALSDPVLEMLTLTTVVIALLAGSYLVLKQTIYLNLGFFQDPARRAGDVDSRSADALRHAGRRLGPDPQARQRSLQDPTSLGRRRPDLRPDGPKPAGLGQQAGRALAAASPDHRIRPRRVRVRGRFAGPRAT